MVINTSFWKKQRVLVTGHTGFKGAWLTIILKQLGASVGGVSLLQEVSTPSLFGSTKLSSMMDFESRHDLLDLSKLTGDLRAFDPTLIFHLAAQAIVIRGYQEPVPTFMSNVMGTVNLLEAARDLKVLTALLVITSDKCYQNMDAARGFVEGDRLGGADPYSASKACAELVTASYQQSFYNEDGRASIATARAGNVIGGGDWADNRLLPDCYRAFSGSEVLKLRSPDSIRPWQHVLEPLTGYMMLAEKMANSGAGILPAWNFGPDKSDELKTLQVAETARDKWGDGHIQYTEPESNHKETKVLRLDSTKAKTELNWACQWSADTAIDKTMDWYKSVHDGADPLEQTVNQINEYYD